MAQAYPDQLRPQRHCPGSGQAPDRLACDLDNGAKDFHYYCPSCFTSFTLTLDQLQLAGTVDNVVVSDHQTEVRTEELISRLWRFLDEDSYGCPVVGCVARFRIFDGTFSQDIERAAWEHPEHLYGGAQYILLGRLRERQALREAAKQGLIWPDQLLATESAT